MKQTTLLMSDDTHRQLKSFAALQGVSMGAAIRQLLMVADGAKLPPVPCKDGFVRVKQVVADHQ
ncbi:hypothetical protein ACHHRT_04105 [Desulfurivibrio sp. D14AmB]|uniref:hypothetical protein n=1 Tax=Desulfurivibrio sp. D14AmB TaxID=3374370 RepID=UPI00376EEDCB